MKLSKNNLLVVREASKELMAFSNEVANVIGFNPIKEIFDIGNKVNAVAQLLAKDDVAAILEKLENTPAGFLTDKKPGIKYSAQDRANALLVCMSQGAKPTGNEINIISGKGMLVKNYYRRMLDILGQKGSPSSDCMYEMKNWYSNESVQNRGQGIITFKCSVTGVWYNKNTSNDEPFEWSENVSTNFGGNYDTVDKAQGQIQRRAWKKFYERYAGIFIDDAELQHNPETFQQSKITLGSSATEPVVTDRPPVEDAVVVEVQPKPLPTATPMSKAVPPVVKPKPEAKASKSIDPGPQTPPMMSGEKGDLF